MNKKILMFSLVGLFAVALVSAVAYYSLFSVTLNVVNPIQVTGDGDQTISGIVPSADGVVVLGDMVKVDNNGDVEREVTITSEVIEGDSENVEIGYAGKLVLTKKNTITWQPLDPAQEIEIVYTIIGDTFEYDILSGVIPVGYELVYAMDKENRFTDYATVKTLSEINESLPMVGDWNAVADPNYCGNENGFDNYAHCFGAKLWVVNSDDIGTDGVLSWVDMINYYYETDLIHYFDNTEGKYTIGANSFVEFYPLYDFDKLADGTYQIETTIA